MSWSRRSWGPAARRPADRRPDNARPAVVRLGAPTPPENPADPLARDPNLARLEAVLFLADEPLTIKRIAEVAGFSGNYDARQLLANLRELYEQDGSAFQIEELAGGYQLLTRPAYHTWLIRAGKVELAHELRLSPAALETLTIIAYRQPVTRAEVEAVRGVNVTDVIRQLMEKGLVRVSGRHDSLGRPQLYGTTRKFLQTYGFNTLADLPPLSD